MGTINGKDLGSFMAGIIIDACHGKDVEDTINNRTTQYAETISRFADLPEIAEAFELFNDQPTWELGLGVLSDYQRAIVIEHKLNKWDSKKNRNKIAIYINEAAHNVKFDKAPMAFIRYIKELKQKYQL